MSDKTSELEAAAREDAQGTWVGSYVTAPEPEYYTQAGTTVINGAWIREKHQEAFEKGARWMAEQLMDEHECEYNSLRKCINKLTGAA